MTKVMASNGIACHMLIQNEQLEQVDTFTYRGCLITEDVKCMESVGCLQQQVQNVQKQNREQLAISSIYLKIAIEAARV